MRLRHALTPRPLRSPGNRERLEEVAALAGAFARWLEPSAAQRGASLRVNAFLTAAGLQDINLFQLLRWPPCCRATRAAGLCDARRGACTRQSCPPAQLEPALVPARPCVQSQGLCAGGQAPSCQEPGSQAQLSALRRHTQESKCLFKVAGFADAQAGREGATGAQRAEAGERAVRCSMLGRQSTLRPPSNCGRGQGALQAGSAPGTRLCRQ